MSEKAGSPLDPLQRLVDIDAIQQLKARYFRFIDTQKWDDLEEVFTTDVAFTFPGTAGQTRQGRSDLIAYIRKSLEGGRSVHHGHTPEVVISGPTTASAIWAMSDFVEHKAENGARRVLVGSGHYHEEYRKDGERWRISSMRLTRLRVDDTVTKSDHLV